MYNIPQNSDYSIYLDFDVNFNIENNVLLINIISRRNVDLYGFMLIKNGHKIAHTYSKYNNYKFKLEESGIYMVQGYIYIDKKPFYKRTISIQYFNKSDINAYLNFINSNTYLTSYKIPIYLKKYPYNDFLLCLKNKNNNNTNISKRFNLNKNLIYDRYILFTTSKVKLDTKGHYFIFSGKVFLNNNFIYGDEDLASIDDITKIKNKVGSYSCIIFNKSSDNTYVKIFTDFFNMTRIFFYKKNDDFYISNNYHLLISILRCININLQINRKKIVSQLCTVSQQIFLQNFSHKMDILGIYQLPIYNDIIINNFNFKIKKNALFYILKNKRNIIKSSFLTILKHGKKEIINNISSIISNKNVENIIVDLTGGLDSRVVYGAVTNFDSKKICINCNKTSSNDYEFASKINSFFKIPTKNIQVDVNIVSSQKADEIQRSYYMGTYFSHNLRTQRIINNNIKNIKFSGALGEIICRPYYARNFAYAPIPSNLSANEYLEEALKWISPHFILGYKQSISYVKKFISDEILKFNSSCNIEKMDLLYLFFRNTYHFDPYFSDIEGLIECCPLMSKNIFYLKHIQKNWSGNISLQLELIGCMNPLLLLFDFDDPRDTKELHFLKKTLNNWYDFLNNIKINYCDINNSNISSTLKKILHNDKDKDKDKVNEFNMSLNYLSFLSKKFPEMQIDIFLPIYYFILSNKFDTKKIRFIYNKLSSFYDQVIAIS